MAKLTPAVHADEHVQGGIDAPVVLVEYGDYECPHCGRAHPIVKRIQKKFGKELALVFRNFPLNEIHPNAESAAETAEFAAKHARFWPMHDINFEHQAELAAHMLIDRAEEWRLNRDDLRSALEGGTFTDRVKQDFMSGVRSGVNGTPTFFINGQRHDGSFDFDELSAAIEDQTHGN